EQRRCKPPVKLSEALRLNGFASSRQCSIKPRWMNDHFPRYANKGIERLAIALLPDRRAAQARDALRDRRAAFRAAPLRRQAIQRVAAGFAQDIGLRRHERGRDTR